MYESNIYNSLAHWLRSHQLFTSFTNANVKIFFNSSDQFVLLMNWFIAFDSYLFNTMPKPKHVLQIYSEMTQNCTLQSNKTKTNRIITVTIHTTIDMNS